VSKFRVLLKYWLPVVIWFGLIFFASSDQSSMQHSSRLIAPLVRWLFPHAAVATVDQVVYLVRKCAHVTEYALLALLFWRALRKPFRGDARPWSWREPRVAILLCAIYAATDELHQTFVPTRQGSVADVLLDTAGAGLGIIVWWLIGRWRKKW
jgi:VanZ family protein